MAETKFSRRILLKAAGSAILAPAVTASSRPVPEAVGSGPSPPPVPTARRRLVPQRMTPDGWVIDRVHYSLVPGYDFVEASEGLSDEAVRRELEIDWSASEGKRVYPQFSRERHVASDPLVPDITRPFYCGWDFGGCPAFVPTQLNVFGQWLIFPSLSPPEGLSIGIYEFGQMVADHMQREYASKYGVSLDKLTLIHFGDPAGAARPPRTGQGRKETQSCFDILKRGLIMHAGTDDNGEPVVHKKPGWDWTIIPGAVNITERLEAVRGRLTTSLAEGHSAMVVCCNADAVIRGLSGGYHYHQRADGHYEYDPHKDWFSHTADSYGYIATRLFMVPAKSARDEDEEEYGLYAMTFRSGACSRYEG